MGSVPVIATCFVDRDARGVSIPASANQTPKLEMGYEKKLEIPTFARKQKEQTPTDTVKLKKISVLSSSEDEEKYEIPTFLRRQVD